MAKGRMDLSGFVGKLLAEQDGDVLREGVRVLVDELLQPRFVERARGGFKNAARLSLDEVWRSSWRGGAGSMLGTH